ncbi:9920_t:CDS:1, partial [Acaulospora morrowiae]
SKDHDVSSLVKRGDLDNGKGSMGVNVEGKKLRKKSLKSNEEINRKRDFYDMMPFREADDFSQGGTDSNHNTLFKRTTTVESSSTCGAQCIVLLVICSVSVLSLAFGISYFVLRRNSKSKINPNSKGNKPIDGGSPDNHPLILPDTVPESWSIDIPNEIIRENFAFAEKFTTENPPQEELPPFDIIPSIQELGGAKAWEWLPVESSVTEPTISISNEGK